MVARTLSVGSMLAENVELTQVGTNLYRLEEEAMLFLGADDDEDVEGFPRYGDILFATPTPEGALRLESIQTRADLRRFDLTVGSEVAASERLAAVLRKVVAEGGHWERLMGGLLFIALPMTSTFDPVAELRLDGGT